MDARIEKNQPTLAVSESPANSELSPEQQDTVRRLEQLLGRAVADRYIDFCHLSAGAFTLRVSRPIAGHALREVESIIRIALKGSLNIQSPCTSEDETLLEQAQKQLSTAGFDEKKINAAINKLRPRYTHKEEIELISSCLGLDPQGDIAKKWKSLCDTFGRAHERSYHHTLAVDDNFRDKFQYPFESVIRAIIIAFQERYSAPMGRAEKIAAMTDIKKAVSLFKTEVPGALALQWHFFKSLSNPSWLPELIKEKLIGEPLIDLNQSDNDGIRPRVWPAGNYLLRMAASSELSTRKLVAEAIRNVAPSKHPDVRRDGIEIIAALPPEEAATLVDIAATWLDGNTGFFTLQAPERLLKQLAEEGQSDAALHLGRALLKIVAHNGEIISLYSRHMYEYSLPGLMQALTKACSTEALKLFCELLQEAVTISGKISIDPPADYSDVMSFSISNDEIAKHDIYSALIVTVRQSAEILIQENTGHLPVIIEILDKYTPRIFRRLALNILANSPASAPDIAEAYLADLEFIEEDRFRHEYAELAIAWFPSLTPEKQEKILHLVDSIPGRYLEGWKARFEAHKKHPPTAEDERIYSAAIIQGVLWEWRTVLPKERQEALEKIVAEIGGPDDRLQNLFSQEESPLTEQDFITRPAAEIINFLKEWHPQKEPYKQTITALAQELRQAVQQNPLKYAETAEQFSILSPIYVRRLFEGLHNVTRNKGNLPWGEILILMDATFSSINEKINPASIAEGDDPDWLWAGKAAAELLREGLRLGTGGIEYRHAEQVKTLILKLLHDAPKEPELEDFEERFKREPYFGAEATLRGLAIELCILSIFWLSKDEASIIARKPREALINSPEIRTALEEQLTDYSSNGRIPRVIIGRYLHWVGYFGEEWLKSQMVNLFPDSHESLQRAAWLGHLRYDQQGPIKQFIKELHSSYADEIKRLNSKGSDNVKETLGTHLIILYIWGALPNDLLEEFWKSAPSRIRQHVMWFLGTQLALSEKDLPSEFRARGFAYWESRLSAAIKSSDPDSFREELGAIGQWFNRDQIDTSWLLKQLLLMLRSGFVPKDIFTALEWLIGIAAQDVNAAMEALHMLLTSPHVDRWAYITSPGAIRAIMTEGQEKGTPATRTLVEKLVGHLASVGETGYLDIIRQPKISSTS